MRESRGTEWGDCGGGGGSVAELNLSGGFGFDGFFRIGGTGLFGKIVPSIICKNLTKILAYTK